MSNFAREWKDAKTKFETSTGIGKPAKEKTIPIIGATYRKGTGFEGSLKALDQLLNSIPGIPKKKELAAIEQLISDVDTKGTAYLVLLNDAIKKEITGPGGKEASVIYRDLKILRASLENTIAQAKRDFAKFKAQRAAEELGLDDVTKKNVVVLTHLSEALEASCRKSLVGAQNLLKNPTPAAFNGAFPGLARDITQPLANIRTYTMPNELSERLQLKRMEKLDNQAMMEAAHNLAHKAENCRAKLLPLLQGQGNTPLDSDLEKMANNPPKFAANERPETVLQATKHFIAQAKSALDIAAAIR